MAKVKLTAGCIAAFKCDDSKAQDFLWCDEVPGLAVRVTQNFTKKSYIFQSKVNRQTMRITIGQTSMWSIEQAKAEARRLQIRMWLAVVFASRALFITGSIATWKRIGHF
jgi:hypothetical protein